MATITGDNENNYLLGTTTEDIIYGMDGNDYLDGGAGIDSLYGGLGNDKFIVKNTADIVIEATNEGTDTVYSSVDYTLSNNIENLTLTGKKSLHATGNSANNILAGNQADNFLDGGAGADILKGNEGNDYLKGGDGDDILYGGLGNDFLRGGKGNDTYVFGRNNGQDLLTDFQNEAGADVVKFVNILPTEITFMSSFYSNGPNYGDLVVKFKSEKILVVQHYFRNADTFKNYQFEFVNDKEVVIGKKGWNDLKALGLAGTSAFDYIHGYETNDVINGKAGNDYLYGEAGNDILTGGSGADWLTGGLGSDTFNFDSVTETGTKPYLIDNITDFNHAEGDKIDLSDIDAHIQTTANDAFTFIGTAEFNLTDATGQLRFDAVNNMLYGSINTDSVAELAIKVTGVSSLAQTDFVL